MIVTPASVDAIFYGFDTRWSASYLAAVTFYDKFSTVMPSSARENRYTWPDRLPKMREWLGERQKVNAIVQEYTLANRDWEITLELDRNTIKDDQIGLFNPLIPGLGTQTKLWPDHLMQDVFINGTTADTLHTTFDGQAFFSSSHPIDTANPASATQSNLFTGATFGANAWATVEQTMEAYQYRDGAPVGVSPDQTIVPPSLKFSSMQVFNQAFIAPAVAFGQNAGSVVQSNPLKGVSDVIVFPYLAASYGGSDTIYYVFDSKGIVRPLIFQLREAPQFVYKNRVDDDNVFMRRKFLYGADSRGAAGYGLYYYGARAGP